MSNLKIEGKVGDFCPKCKNCKAVTRMHDGETASIRLTEVECEDPYDGMTKTLDADSDICCSMFEMKSEKSCDKISLLRHELEMDKLRMKIHELEKEKAAHMKGIEHLKKSQEKLQNQVKNLQTTNEESYKREEKLEDKVHKLERRLLEENKRFDRLDTEFLMPLARVLYPREAKICKPYSEILKDIKNMSNVMEDLKKRAADSDLYKEKSELLEVKLKNANEVADSWKRDYERIREQFLCPIYDILYPDNPNLDINVTDLLNYVKVLKVYGNENKKMYKELQEWREKCISRGNDIDHLLSEKKEKDKKIGELESRKEECEKKYRDEISKLQNIVTEKEVEIKGLRKDNVRLNKDISWGNMIAEKNTELNQTISDQEMTIKALLITIKEMCKDE